MDITNFDSVRVGSGFPACFDIKKIGIHESYGVFATTYIFKNDNGEMPVVEVRRKNERIAIFAHKYKPVETEKLPSDWENSELLWSSEQNSREH